MVESLREASCRAWKRFSNGSSLLPECRECPSFVLNALLNEARTIGVCQILPMSCQTVQPMISAVCFLLRPPKCHCRASRQMDGRRAAPQCEESGAIRQREKKRGSWCSPVFAVRKQLSSSRSSAPTRRRFCLCAAHFFAIAQRICLNIPREGGHKIPRPSLWPP